MAEERFSEKEVSVVLRRAAEIDAAGSVGPSGMSRADIEAVAREAGIGVEAVNRALAELSADAEAEPKRLLAPTSHRISHQLPLELDRDQLNHMIRVVEDSARRPGQVTEALGTIRWTSQETNQSVTQVSLTPSADGTHVSVHERVPDSIRLVSHLLPTLWGGMIGAAVSAAASGPLMALPIVVGAAAGGFGIGRAFFSWLAKRREGRVKRLAQRLEEQGRAMLAAAKDVPALSEPEA